LSSEPSKKVSITQMEHDMRKPRTSGRGTRANTISTNDLGRKKTGKKIH